MCRLEYWDEKFSCSHCINLSNFCLFQAPCGSSDKLISDFTGHQARKSRFSWLEDWKHHVNFFVRLNICYTCENKNYLQLWVKQLSVFSWLWDWTCVLWALPAVLSELPGWIYLLSSVAKSWLDGGPVRQSEASTRGERCRTSKLA